MSEFKWDHIQYRSVHPDELATFFVSMFGAVEAARQEIAAGLRIALTLDGLRMLIEQVPPGTATPPAAPHAGLEHIGLIVTDLDRVAAALRGKGAVFWKEPTSPRPGVKVAFVQGPDGVLVELLERSAA